jgi:predicted nucleotidyltransferase
MTSATEERLTELVERLRPLHPVKILLFGSAARGQDDAYSDLDVIVVAERLAPRFLDRIAQAYDLLDPRYAIDILIYTPEEYEAMLEDENPLLQTAEREGRELYARPAA